MRRFARDGKDALSKSETVTGQIYRHLIRLLKQGVQNLHLLRGEIGEALHHDLRMARVFAVIDRVAETIQAGGRILRSVFTDGLVGFEDQTQLL